MSRQPTRSRPTQAQLLGAALKRLRRRYDLSQARAAELANARQQTWQRWEGGGNDALLKPTLQRRLVEAMGATMEEFEEEFERGEAPDERRPPGVRLRPLELPLQGHVRAGPLGVNVVDQRDPDTIDLSAFFGDDARVLRLAGESMIPYAEPGGFVTYNLKRYPRRGQGCVIRLNNGDYYVKRYERTTDAKLYVTELHPVERELEFDLVEVAGIYPVGLRGD